MAFTIAHVLEQLDRQMPSLSPTASKVMQLANSLNCSPLDLTKVIKLDPVLSAKVLKLVNSSYFAMPAKVTSLEKAVIMLGVNTIKNLALGAAVLAQVDQNAKYAFTMDDFWQHALGVGVVAKAIALTRQIPRKEVEDYFLAGMMHDLGLLIENLFYPEEMGRIALTAPALGLLTVEEGELDGLNHCLVGEALGRKWQLSEDLVFVMRQHHNPLAESAHTALHLTVYLANLICQNRGVGLVLDDAPQPLDPLALETLGLNEGIAETALVGLDDEIKKAREFLKA